MKEYVDQLNSENYRDIAKDERGENVLREAKIGDQYFQDGNVIQFKMKRIRDKNPDDRKMWIFGVVRANKVIGAGGQYFILAQIEKAELVSIKPVGMFRFLRKPGDNIVNMNIASMQKTQSLAAGHVPDDEDAIID